MSRRRAWPAPALSPEETPRTSGYWARRWRVHRDTARRLLAYLHRTVGRKVVWRSLAGRGRGDYVASEASLQVVSVLRSGGNLVLVLGRGAAPQEPGGRHRGGREEDGEGYVTEEQHSRALGEVWRALAQAGIRRTRP